MFPESRMLAGLRFDHVSSQDLINWMTDRVGSRFGYLVTPNIDHLVRLERRPDLRYLYSEADICVCDSRVLAGLCRLFRLPVPTVVPGSDLVALAASSGFFLSRSVTIIGGQREMVDRLVKRGMLGHVFHFNPSMGFAHDPSKFAECVAFVESHPADVVLFAVGSPQQEQLANAVRQNGRSLGAGLCIGASLLFLAGDESRAPKIMRRLGLEWLFRLLANPRRLARRYLVDGPRIIGILGKDSLRANER